MIQSGPVFISGLLRWLSISDRALVWLFMLDRAPVSLSVSDRAPVWLNNFLHELLTEWLGGSLMPAVIALNLHTRHCNTQLLHTRHCVTINCCIPLYLSIYRPYTVQCVTLNCNIHLNSVRHHHHHHLYCDLDMKLMENLLIWISTLFSIYFWLDEMFSVGSLWLNFHFLPHQIRCKVNATQMQSHSMGERMKFVTQRGKDGQADSRSRIIFWSKTSGGKFKLFLGWTVWEGGDLIINVQLQASGVLLLRLQGAEGS